MQAMIVCGLPRLVCPCLLQAGSRDYRSSFCLAQCRSCSFQQVCTVCTVCAYVSNMQMCALCSVNVGESAVQRVSVTAHTNVCLCVYVCVAFRQSTDHLHYPYWYDRSVYKPRLLIPRPLSVLLYISKSLHLFLLLCSKRSVSDISLDCLRALTFQHCTIVIINMCYVYNHASQHLTHRDTSLQ